MTATHLEIETVEWLGMRLNVPAGWEILRHSVRPEKGRLVFVDRRHQRLLLTWAACIQPPEARELFADYQRNAEEENPESRFEPLSTGFGWTGFRQFANSGALTRAGRFEPSLQRWIEVTLSWPDDIDSDVEEVLLGNFSTAPSSRCRAFGLDVETPDGWPLYEVQAKPADLTFIFRQGKAEARVHRVGLLEAWYRGDLESYLRKQLDGAQGAFSTSAHLDHSATRCEGREPGSKANELLGRLRDRRDLAWECPPAHAIFLVTTLSPRKAPVQPEDFVVRCHGIRR